jgi:hypothetical protein
MGRTSAGTSQILIGRLPLSKAFAIISAISYICGALPLGGLTLSEIHDHIEQYLHIAEMKAELNELSDGMMAMGTCEDMGQGLEEDFLESILAYERAEQVPFRTLLERDGVTLPAPNELSDEELSAKLDEVIQAMARQRNFLDCTNHLSDRELYKHLIEISFEETVPDLPPDDRTNYHLDITGGCSDEDIAIYLKYYADEDSRVYWAESWPDMVIPPHEDPPYDRDRHLPKPPPPPNPYDNPEVEAEWCAKHHRKLLAQLADKCVTHGDINSEPVSFAPPIASVWAVESKDCKGTVEWWALNGECPFTFISAKDVSNPRAFLRLISQRWHAEVDALETAYRQAEDIEESSSKPQIRLHPFHMRRRYARILEDWAADDSAWDEEWKVPVCGS